MPSSFVPIFGMAAFSKIATNAKTGVSAWISLSGRRGHGDAADSRLRSRPWSIYYRARHLIDQGPATSRRTGGPWSLRCRGRHRTDQDCRTSAEAEGKANARGEPEEGARGEAEGPGRGACERPGRGARPRGGGARRSGDGPGGWQSPLAMAVIGANSVDLWGYWFGRPQVPGDLRIRRQAGGCLRPDPSARTTVCWVVRGCRTRRLRWSGAGACDRI